MMLFLRSKDTKVRGSEFRFFDFIRFVSTSLENPYLANLLLGFNNDKGWVENQNFVHRKTVAVNEISMILDYL